MAKARGISMLKMGVLLLVAAFGGMLLAFTPPGSRDRSEALLAKMRIELPYLSITRSDRMLRSDEIYVAAALVGGETRTNPIARIRPLSADRMRVAMYDEANRDYGRESIMDMDAAISRIGLESTRP